MRVDNFAHVISAGIATFDRFHIEDLTQKIVFIKMFIY